jgi:hypothetical protein
VIVLLKQMSKVDDLQRDLAQQTLDWIALRQQTLNKQEAE